MKIVTYLDNDELNRPETEGAPIYSVDVPRPLSPQQLIEQSPTVFGEGVGRLEGQYHIRLDESVSPGPALPSMTPSATLRDI